MGGSKKRRIRAKAAARGQRRAALPYEEHQRRLYLLRGLPCPLCGLTNGDPPPLEWTGVSLTCSLSHGWSNADALRADMKHRAKQPKTKQPKAKRVALKPA